MAKGGMCVEGEACVAKGGMHGEGGCAWQRGAVHGKGGACVAKGAYVVKGDMCGRGRAWQGGMNGRKDGHCSGQYASYWNAFLLQMITLSFQMISDPLLLFPQCVPY